MLIQYGARGFKLSNDSFFVEKPREVVGLISIRPTSGGALRR
jgi:hypothetical protein